MTLRQPESAILHHSDRGSQYTSKAYQEYLTKIGAVDSMSRVGSCYDNLVAEHFFGRLKSERTDHEIDETRAQAKAAVIDYIGGFYNTQR